MAQALQDFEDLASDPSPTLQWLIRIGVSAYVYWADVVTGVRKLALKKSGGVGLEEEAAFEVETRGQPHVGMRRSGIAINAPVLTTSIRIDRAVETHVRALVAG